jgi:hypothetical protein
MDVIIWWIRMLHGDDTILWFIILFLLISADPQMFAAQV